MSRQRFVKRTLVNVPAVELFAWHKQPDVFERLIPSGESIRVIRKTGSIEQLGSEMELEIKLFGFIKVIWLAEHVNYIENEAFQDIQRKGPFAYWLHTHRFIPINANSSFLEDDITYEIPFGFLGNLLAGPFIRHKLQADFKSRHQIVKTQLETV